MKIIFKHLSTRINGNPNIHEVSEKLMQLGHEHTIKDNILDFEFTPNRGDCLSVNGLLRDLQVFYDIKPEKEFFFDEIKEFNINFKNFSKKLCPKISFLKIEIEDNISDYKDELKEYFFDLQINKNNFFTDISNYISYEIGQPTHCYDLSKIQYPLSLRLVDGNHIFHTLLDNKNVNLSGDNLVFLSNDEIINLAGVIGGASTSCTKKTRSVLLECAYFNPETIIGKSVKYDINSDAAHKFERGVDPKSHEKVIRRYISIVKKHAKIKSLELFSKVYDQDIEDDVLVPYDLNTVNKVLGTKISNADFDNYLSSLGFKIKDQQITVPSWRSDIKSQNDIAEEIARAIGYDFLPTKKITISNHIQENNNDLEIKLKNYLIDNGFYEVINYPFVSDQEEKSIKVDNPLDSNKKFLRTNLKNSLIECLKYNEKRQKDSIKLFEISDVYCDSSIKRKKVIGIIASGRVGKNYKDFSKKINKKYLSKLLNDFIANNSFEIQILNRNHIDSKAKTEIVYVEIQIDNIEYNFLNHDYKIKQIVNFPRYIPISEYPSSIKDLSFSIKDFSKSSALEDLLLNYEHIFLKEKYVFDYYKNDKLNEIKLGFRFVFQSNHKTLTDNEIKDIMDDIIKKSLKIKSITLPGL